MKRILITLLFTVSLFAQSDTVQFSDTVKGKPFDAYVENGKTKMVHSDLYCICDLTELEVTLLTIQLEWIRENRKNKK